jgi:hypothetical protein
MGAFLGYDLVGVWASNRERNAFLDWFAAHRCSVGDAAWNFCKSEGNRWTGCCIQLDELIPRGKLFEVSAAEQAEAATEFWLEVGMLLKIVSQITHGEWTHSVSSKEAVDWRPAQNNQEGRATNA